MRRSTAISKVNCRNLLMAAASFAALAALSSGPVWAAGCSNATATWNAGSSGYWNTANAWSTGSIPNSSTCSVDITDNSSTVTFSNSSATTYDIDNLQVGSHSGSLNELNISTTNDASSTLDMYGATLANYGTINISSNSSSYSAVLGVDAGDDISLTGGGTINFSYTGSAAMNNARMTDMGGAFSLTNVNNLIEGGGEIGGALSSIDNQANGTVLANLSGTTLELADVGTITNEGTFEADGGTLALQSANDGSITNSNEFIATGSNSVLEVLIGNVTNNGTVEADSGGEIELASTNTSFTNNGVVDIKSGSEFSGTTLTNNSGGEVEGAGKVVANLMNYGTVTPGTAGGAPGMLTITGNYTQESNGTLDIQIDGASFGDYGRLVVSGTADLAGTLAVNLLDGFTLKYGDTFQILDAGTDPGDFSAFTFDGAGCTSGLGDTWHCAGLGSLYFKEEFLSGGKYLDLAVVPEPTSLMLFGSGLVAAGWFARRRKRPV